MVLSGHFLEKMNLNKTKSEYQGDESSAEAIALRQSGPHCVEGKSPQRRLWMFPC